MKIWQKCCRKGVSTLAEIRNKYLKLFFSTLRLSACTFGGGFVIVPLMRRRFVEELGWIGEQEMLDITAIAQTAPGTTSVNASILVGYRVAGVPGALLTVLGTVLPPLIIISVVSPFYSAFREHVIVNRVMTGMFSGVAAVVCDVVITMGREVLRTRRLLYVVLMLAAFVAVRFLCWNVILVILACAGVGAADTLLILRRGRGDGDP